MTCSASEPLQVLLELEASDSRSMAPFAVVNNNPARRLELLDVQETVTCAASLEATLRGSCVAGQLEDTVQVGNPSEGERWPWVPCYMAPVEGPREVETCRTVLRKRSEM